jgi:hypothetical protein
MWFPRLAHGSLRSNAVRARVVSREDNTMPTYRAYLVNGEDRVTSYKQVDADTDVEALMAARHFAKRCDVEVWLLDRKIGRLERTGK